MCGRLRATLTLHALHCIASCSFHSPTIPPTIPPPCPFLFAPTAPFPPCLAATKPTMAHLMNHLLVLAAMLSAAPLVEAGMNKAT